MQGTEAGSRSSRFTRDQAHDPLQRTNSSAAQQASPGAAGEAFSLAAFDVQPFSQNQQSQPEAGDKKTSFAVFVGKNEKACTQFAAIG